MSDNGAGVLIIIPTYNERANIAPLLDALQEQFATIEHDMYVLVVDDETAIRDMLRMALEIAEFRCIEAD